MSSIAQANRLKELERRIEELERQLIEHRRELGKAIAAGPEKRKPGRPPKNG